MNKQYTDSISFFSFDIFILIPRIFILPEEAPTTNLEVNISQNLNLVFNLH
jgi:hypothetical protein